MAADRWSAGAAPWFAPRMWGLHVFAVAAVAFTVVMGLWQLGVYDSRQAAERSQEPSAVPLHDVLRPDQAFTESANHRAVTAQGTYAPGETQFWVSGRAHDGTDGYWLVAPFLVDGAEQSGRSEAALLVVRGWAPDNTDPPAPPDGRVELRAVLQAGEERSDGLDAGLGPERTTGTIRIPYLVGELPYDLYSGFGIATEQDPPVRPGLVPVEPPEPGAPWTVGWRNLAYAVQWWVFGAFAVFMWWRMARDMAADARPGSEEAAGRPVA